MLHFIKYDQFSKCLTRIEAPICSKILHSTPVSEIGLDGSDLSPFSKIRVHKLLSKCQVVFPISKNLCKISCRVGANYLCNACMTKGLNLSVTSRINCIVARCLINVVYLTTCCLYKVMMTLHILNDVANDAGSIC